MNLEKKTAVLCVLPLLAGALLFGPAFGASSEPPGGKDFARANAGLLNELNDSCRKGSLDLVKLVARLKDQPKALAYVFSEHETGAFALYRVCVDAARGQRDGCAIFQGLDSTGFSGSSAYCRAMEDFSATLAGVFRQGDASAPCLRMMAGSPVPKDKLPRVCGLVTAAMKSGGSESLCKGARADGILPDDKAVQECRLANAYLDGVPKKCPPVSDPSAQADCRERAAFLGGLRSKDPQACAASPLCGALTSGKPQACAPYLTLATKVFCDSRSGMAQKEGDNNTRLDQEQRLKIQQAKDALKKAQKVEAKAMADKAGAEITKKAQLVEKEKLKKAAEERDARAKPQYKAGQRMMAIPTEYLKNFKPAPEGTLPQPTPPPDNQQQR